MRGAETLAGWSRIALMGALVAGPAHAGTEAVSVGLTVPTEPASGSSLPSISASGRYVAFRSWADNLVSADTNGTLDIFVHDRATGETARVSLDSAGAEGNDGSYGHSISGDGRYVAFSSDASNLVAGDTNGVSDEVIEPLCLDTELPSSRASNSRPKGPVLRRLGLRGRDSARPTA